MHKAGGKAPLRLGPLLPGALPCPAQKVQVATEHFRAQVRWRLNGKAKAMVVTNSRKEAVRYKVAADQ